METATPDTFMDCRNGNHEECLFQWPNGNFNESQAEIYTTCDCECHRRQQSAPQETPAQQGLQALPCPFGANHCRIGDLRFYELPDSPSRHVFCSACNSSGPWGEGNEEACRLWNTRARWPPVETKNATATPWAISESKVPGYERVISIVASGNLAICRLDGAGSLNPNVLEKVRANAELIVKCVNRDPAFQKLLEAIEAEAARQSVKAGLGVSEWEAFLWPEAREALRLAREGEK